MVGSIRKPSDTNSPSVLPVSAMLALALAGCGEPECKPYHGFMEGSTWVHVDPDNGCAYYKSSYSMTPKLDASGRQICYAPKECPKAEGEKAAQETAFNDGLPVYDIRQCDEEWRTRFIINGEPNTEVCRRSILKAEAAGEAHVIGRK